MMFEDFHHWNAAFDLLACLEYLRVIPVCAFEDSGTESWELVWV